MQYPAAGKRFAAAKPVGDPRARLAMESEPSGDSSNRLVPPGGLLSGCALIRRSMNIKR